MLWLKRVIARLLGIQIQPLDNLVPPTQTVGLVSKELTTPVGNKRSARTSTQRQSQSPVRQHSPKKPKAVKSTTVALKGTSKKQEPAQTAKSRKVAGNSTPIPVSKTPLHAKLKAKPKP
jgi:hypothetical protein